jgi:hypothetical protein
VGNKLYEIFNPNSDYNKRIIENARRIHQEFIDNRTCFVCKQCKDISDDRNTCHLCKYTNDLLPKELTCLLWELEEENEF